MVSKKTTSEKVAPEKKQTKKVVVANKADSVSSKSKKILDHDKVDQIIEQVRPRIISLPYWGSGLILFSIVLFFLKGIMLHHAGVVDGTTVRETIKWYIAWWGNDVLYAFLIWIFAASAMQSKWLWLKGITVAITMVLLYMYSADVFALIYFHSRFSLSVLWFFSWENAWPYLLYAFGATIIWFLLLIWCVYVVYGMNKLSWYKSFLQKYDFHMIRLWLVVSVLLFVWSFFVSQTSSYQQNIIQLDLWQKSWETQAQDRTYESYFQQFSWKKKKPNIIVVFAESFSSIDSQLAWGNRNLLSWFDTIAKDWALYSNFIANWCTSDTAHIAMLQWVEPWETPKIQQNYTRYKSYSLWLPAFLGQQWYKSSFVSTVSLDFLWQEDLLRSLQFDFIVWSDAFKKWPKYVFRAAPDQALYQEATKMMLQWSKEKPQFIVLQTISSHKPYDSPAGDTEEQALWYADSELLQFYRELQSMHYFDDWILIVVGDHRKMQMMTYDEIEKWGNAAYGKAVMAIVGKDIPAWEIVTTPVQHWDLFSSLKRLTASWSVSLNVNYNDVFGGYEWRSAAIRYCQFVDKQYVASREDGTTWTITPQQRNDLAEYIRAYYTFQQWKSYADIMSGQQNTSMQTWEKLFPWLIRVAHQWVVDQAPPNSLNAFYAAKAQWANGIEMDVSFTKDGYPIVMHGPDIGRTKCVKNTWKKLIQEFDLQEMKDNCTLYNGQVILTLQEVLEKTQNQFSWYFVDIKIDQKNSGEFVRTMLQSIKKLGLSDKVMFSSTDADVNYQLGATNDIVAGWEIFHPDDLPSVLESNHTFVLLPHSIIIPDMVKDIIAAKKHPIAYTVNDSKIMKQLYDRWVRFFITDQPQKILE